MKDLALLLIAGGKSSRFGGEPKMLSKIGPNDETLFEMSICQMINHIHIVQIHIVVNKENKEKIMEEVKRGNQYDGIIMDPPAFGIGAKKERWKIETKFPELVQLASQLLSKNGFLIINTYSPKLKEELIQSTVKEFFPSKKIEINTLSLKSTTGKTLEYGQLTRVY